MTPDQRRINKKAVELFQQFGTYDIPLAEACKAYFGWECKTTLNNVVAGKIPFPFGKTGTVRIVDATVLAEYLVARYEAGESDFKQAG